MLEVNEDDLDIDENHCYSYEGQPFTGTAREYSPTGVIVAETSYLDGCMHGTKTLRFRSGQVEAVIGYKRNMAHGCFVEYHPSGQMAVEGENEYGVCLWRKKYDADGRITENYNININESALTVLRVARKSFGHLID